MRYVAKIRFGGSSPKVSNAYIAADRDINDAKFFPPILIGRSILIGRGEIFVFIDVFEPRRERHSRPSRNALARHDRDPYGEENAVVLREGALRFS